MHKTITRQLTNSYYVTTCHIRTAQPDPKGSTSAVRYVVYSQSN